MILLTGAAGFIGSTLADYLLCAGATVVGFDNLNAYYDVKLKRARLARLEGRPNFRFVEGDVAELSALQAAAPADEIECVVHLAAQAGVRYSLEAPFSYLHSNLAGHLTVLEYVRGLKYCQHLVYASSSSVYGDRQEGPFAETDRCDTPASLYAATKRSCELMSETYARIYAIPQTGLRFFTVYGPWGRPDMAYWSFTEKILAGSAITLFGEGKLLRDFTHVSDIVAVMPRIIASPPVGAAPHRVVNLGNSKPIGLLRFVSAIEQATGKSAKIELAPPQPGDVSTTFADIDLAKRLFGYSPKTEIEEGMATFVDWYLAHRTLVKGG